LEKSQEKDKKYYNRNAKRKKSENGTEVLVILPTDSNKLLMQWKRPYKVIAKVGENDYRVMVGKKLKTFHANMLQLYCRREKEGQQADTGKPQDVYVVGVAECDIEESRIDEETLFKMGNCQQKEDVSIAVLSPDLSDNQKYQLFELLNSYGEIFSDLPGKTDVIKHAVKLSDDKPVTSRLYKLPYAVRENLKTEISDMMKMGVI